MLWRMRIRSGARRAHVATTLLLAAALALAACGDDDGGETADPPGDGEVTTTVAADDAGETSELAEDAEPGCAAAAADAAQAIGEVHFPDNPGVIWDVVATSTDADGRALVEVQPTPDEVGYSRFTFLVDCAAGAPELVATYALDGGAYVLLSTTGADPGDLPDTVPSS